MDAFVVEDPIPPDIDFTKSYVRFVNASSNSNPVTFTPRIRALAIRW